MLAENISYEIQLNERKDFSRFEKLIEQIQLDAASWRGGQSVKYHVTDTIYY